MLTVLTLVHTSVFRRESKHSFDNKKLKSSVLIFTLLNKKARISLGYSSLPLSLPLPYPSLVVQRTEAAR